MVELPKWSQGRVLLLGDSAHCLTLVSGQGAGMALASAEMLGKALLAEADLDKALVLHEQKLRPIIGRLQARSRKMAAMFIPRSAFAFHLRNFIMRNMPRARLTLFYQCDQGGSRFGHAAEPRQGRIAQGATPLLNRQRGMRSRLLTGNQCMDEIGLKICRVFKTHGNPYQLGPMPRSFFCSSGTTAWVSENGCWIRLSTLPRLTAKWK